MSEKLSRRSFLKASAVTAMGAALAACAQPTPTVAPTKPAAQPTAVPPTVAPTAKPAAPTAVPPTVAPTAKPAAPTAVPPTAVPKATYKEAPALADLVKAGKLPSVDQRLPSEPMVVKPKTIGQYGGTWRNVVAGAGDLPGWAGRINSAFLLFWATDGVTVAPQLAQKWEVSADGKTFTFYLRKGHKWSDGKPFTTADIMYYVRGHVR